MNEYEIVTEYLRENLDKLTYNGGSGRNPEIPKFDLFPNDYLGYAEQEINSYKERSEKRYLINCILHLKRALDCQIDIFLHVFNLSKVTRERNLGIKSKLAFLKDAGIVNSRVIMRFNSLRNRIEHQYKIPEITDIEVYFDLITSLISNLELAIFSIAAHDEMEFAEESESDRAVYRYERYGYNQMFTINYSFEEPAITYKIWRENGTNETGMVSLEKVELFSKLFKILFLLIKREALVSDKVILSEL